MGVISLHKELTQDSIQLRQKKRPNFQKTRSHIFKKQHCIRQEVQTKRTQVINEQFFSLPGKIHSFQTNKKCELNSKSYIN